MKKILQFTLAVILLSFFGITDNAYAQVSPDTVGLSATTTTPLTYTPISTDNAACLYDGDSWDTSGIGCEGVGSFFFSDWSASGVGDYTVGYFNTSDPSWGVLCPSGSLSTDESCPAFIATSSFSVFDDTPPAPPATSTIMIVDNPNENLAFAIAFFLGSMVIVIWLMRKH